MDIAIIMLAAGCARRFGSDKRMALMHGDVTVLQQATERAVATRLPVIVCLRPGEETLADRIRHIGAQVLPCRDAHLGMGSTLAEAVRACSKRDGVLVALGDMPHIKSTTYKQIATALTPNSICQPRMRDTSGHPVGFGSAFFPELSRLRGEPGARPVVIQHRDAVRAVAVEDPGILMDIDTPADIQSG